MEALEINMTLRDRFASVALAGMGMWSPVDQSEWPHRDVVQKMRAEWAYEQADAMIEARDSVSTDLIEALRKIERLDVKDSGDLWRSEAFLTLIERLQEVASAAIAKATGEPA